MKQLDIKVAQGGCDVYAIREPSGWRITGYKDGYVDRQTMLPATMGEVDVFGALMMILEEMAK